ncbi:unnamed protein product [Clavelina lepadiformis]|uniref:Secreted protein n=1 Tax=Clavelina lepadiformis TaxID=159417 RepID=A0ABP0G1A6_CLALP
MEIYLMCRVSAFNVICFCLIWIAAKMKKPKKSESEHELISKETPQDTYDTIQDHPHQEPEPSRFTASHLALFVSFTFNRIS